MITYKNGIKIKKNPVQIAYNSLTCTCNKSKQRFFFVYLKLQVQEIFVTDNGSLTSITITLFYWPGFGQGYLYVCCLPGGHGSRV